MRKFHIVPRTKTSRLYGAVNKIWVASGYVRKLSWDSWAVCAKTEFCRLYIVGNSLSQRVFQWKHQSSSPGSVTELEMNSDPRSLRVSRWLFNRPSVRWSGKCCLALYVEEFNGESVPVFSHWRFFKCKSVGRTIDFLKAMFSADVKSFIDKIFRINNICSSFVLSPLSLTGI